MGPKKPPRDGVLRGYVRGIAKIEYAGVHMSMHALAMDVRKTVRKRPMSGGGCAMADEIVGAATRGR